MSIKFISKQSIFSACYFLRLEINLTGKLLISVTGIHRNHNFQSILVQMSSLQYLLLYKAMQNPITTITYLHLIMWFTTKLYLNWSSEYHSSIMQNIQAQFLHSSWPCCKTFRTFTTMEPFCKIYYSPWHWFPHFTPITVNRIEGRYYYKTKLIVLMVAYGVAAFLWSLHIYG